MSDELITSQVVATVVPTGVEGKGVDEAPVIDAATQAEIDRLTKVKADAEEAATKAEEKAIYWRKQKAEARADYFKGGKEPEKPETPAKESETPAPKREDFEDYDAYMDARSIYNAIRIVDEKVDERISKWRKEESEKETKTDYQRKIEGLTTKLEEGYKKYPDFEDVVKDPSVPITLLIRDILSETEHPEDVAYYLGKNRAEAIKISRMTPVAATREILRIEAEVAQKPLSPNQPKIISDAPPPVKAIGSGESIPQKDISKMNQKEYEAYAEEKRMRRF